MKHSAVAFKRCSIGNAEVVFTARVGGYSTGQYQALNLGDHVGDDPELVAANRQLLANQLGLRGLVSMNQVHGTRVTAASFRSHEPASQLNSSAQECDALVTADSGLGLLAMGADCLTVAFGCDDAVGVAHAGWRGLAAGVLQRTVDQLAATAHGEIHAVIGPAAGGCCYEVSEAVIETFNGTAVHSGRLLNLAATAERVLADAGVSSVRSIGSCTICDSEGRFFSHRRDGTPTGRQGAVAWLNS